MSYLRLLPESEKIGPAGNLFKMKCGGYKTASFERSFY